jgi:hypothetical protein
LSFGLTFLDATAIYPEVAEAVPLGLFPAKFDLFRAFLAIFYTILLYRLVEYPPQRKAPLM